MDFNSVLGLIWQNIHLVLIAVFGGFVLFSIKVSEHFHRASSKKMPKNSYSIWVVCIFLFFPVLGGFMVSIYLVNGDKISAVLAFQIGLTSPAIAQSMIIGSANRARNTLIDLPDEA